MTDLRQCLLPFGREFFFCVLVVVQLGLFSHIKGKHTNGKTFGPESEQGAGEWSVSVKEDEMGWACSMGFMGNPEGKITVGRPIHNGRIILKCVLKRQDNRAFC